MLTIVLDTLTVAVRLEPAAGLHFERQLGVLVNACFLHYFADAFVTDAVVQLVKTLAKDPAMVPCLEARLLATVVSILDQYANDQVMICTSLPIVSHMS